MVFNTMELVHADLDSLNGQNPGLNAALFENGLRAKNWEVDQKGTGARL